MATNFDASQVLARAALPGVPMDATPFHGGGAAAVNTGAAAIALKAAVTGKRHWITEWEVTNKTAGEYPICELTEDPAGTPVILAWLAPGAELAATAGTTRKLVFNPPIVVTASKAIGYQLQSATGDCYSVVRGFVEA
jgi:hypothetical protein